MAEERQGAQLQGLNPHLAITSNFDPVIGPDGNPSGGKWKGGFGQDGIGSIVTQEGREVTIRVPEEGEFLTNEQIADFANYVKGSGTMRVPPVGQPGAPTGSVWGYIDELRRQLNAVQEIVDAAFIGDRFRHYEGNLVVVASDANGGGPMDNYLGTHIQEAESNDSQVAGLNVLQRYTSKGKSINVDWGALRVIRHSTGRITGLGPIIQPEKNKYEGAIDGSDWFTPRVSNPTPPIRITDGGVIGLRQFPAEGPPAFEKGTPNMGFVYVDSNGDLIYCDPDGTSIPLNGGKSTGNGELGDVVISSDTNIGSGAQNYMSLTVNAGVNLYGTAGEPMIINVKGDLIVNGTIHATGKGAVAPTAGGAGTDKATPGVSANGNTEHAMEFVGTASGGGGGGGSGAAVGGASQGGGGGGTGGPRSSQSGSSALGGRGSGGAGGAGQAVLNNGFFGLPGVDATDHPQKATIQISLENGMLVSAFIAGGAGGVGGGGGSGGNSGGGAGAAGGAAGAAGSTTSATPAGANGGNGSVGGADTGNGPGGGGAGSGGSGGGAIIIRAGGNVILGSSGKIEANGGNGGDGGDGGGGGLAGAGAGGAGSGGGGGLASVAYGGTATNLNTTTVTADGGSGGTGGTGGVGSSRSGGLGGDAGDGEDGYVVIQQMC